MPRSPRGTLRQVIHLALLYQASYDIKDDNHVVMTITMRDTARHPDWPGPELDITMVQGD